MKLEQFIEGIIDTPDETCAECPEFSGHSALNHSFGIRDPFQILMLGDPHKVLKHFIESVQTRYSLNEEYIFKGTESVKLLNQPSAHDPLNRDDWDISVETNFTSRRSLVNVDLHFSDVLFGYWHDKKVPKRYNIRTYLVTDTNYEHRRYSHVERDRRIARVVVDILKYALKELLPVCIPYSTTKPKDKGTVTTSHSLIHEPQCDI